MSRIYDALKRAESEQQAWLGGHPMATPLSGETATSKTGFSAEQNPELLFLTANLASGVRTASSITPILDTNTVQKKSWSPSLDNLPAFLMEGAIAEQFRSLRARLFELRDQAPFKSLLISSGLPKEGKSFVAANLAISLARHPGSRVLLIDGDMRHGALHAILGCGSRPGLSDYLSGKAGILEIIQAADTAGKPSPLVLDNLAFIAAGDSGGEAADLSGSPLFGDLTAAVSAGFDWIVVDSSPVIAASDAVNLARACDAVLLVARSGVTPAQAAQRAHQEMKASRILGLVLNGANPTVVGRHSRRSSLSARAQLSAS